MTMFQRKQVLFTNESDPEYGKPELAQAIVLDEKWALSIFEGHEWSFRSITGEQDGNPVVALDKCRHFNFDLDLDVTGSNIWRLLDMTIWEIAQKYAR